MKKTVKDIEVQGKRVIVRCDFNVPMKDGAITDDIRIVSALPTIKYLVEHKAKVILMSHMGRPKGEADMQYSLKPVAERLSSLLGQEVLFVSSPVVVDDQVRAAAEGLQEGQVMLLENVRFRKRKREMARDLPENLHHWQTFLSTMLLELHTAHTLPRPGLRTSFQPFPVS